ncbi:MAG: TonB-dependent receptor [Chitinophagaceae bacterium]|nr:TonB-dependent receptor [Chitinophagaceae bacterium]
MRLTAIILLSASLNVSASGFSQEITLNLKNVPLGEVFNEIQKQSGYVFFYNANLLKEIPRVSLKTKRSGLTEMLDKCFADLPLHYVIIDKTIVVKPRKLAQQAATEQQAAVAANIVVEGIVSSSDGVPLVGASVKLKGTALGTVTDAQGRFSLSLPEKGGTLTISYVGYQSFEIAVTKDQVIQARLVALESAIDEVVVVGYGTQKKSDLTGAISSVKGADLTNLPVQRVDQALQGRASGIYVLNTDGSPGGNTIIRVRGMNSINGGNGALIVIDGLQGGNLNSLNPNDIASIEILKDASATAIYGSQGANGVILITTKLGRTGKPVINYGYNVGVQQLRKKLDFMDAADFARTMNAATAMENGSGIPPEPIFTEAEIQEFEKTGGTDWLDVIYRTAVVQNHQLSISGGSENVRYLVSGGYLDQPGILKGSSYKRLTLRANLEANVNKWAVFGLNWAGSKEAGNTTLAGDGNPEVDWRGNPLSSALRWAPTAKLYNPDGSYANHPYYGSSSAGNPLANAIEPYFDNNTVRNNINTYLDFKILEGLKFRVSLGGLFTNVNNLDYYNRKTKHGLSRNGYGESYTEFTKRYQNSNILTYDKTFGSHHFTVTGVAEQQYERGNIASLVAENFLSDETRIYDLGAALNTVNASSAYERVLNSYLGRIHYAFANKYLFTASFRADGSSVFGEHNKWGYFPSMSLAWNLGAESFIQDLDVFSELKLRGSWGITGNQAISAYQTIAKVSSGYNYPYNGTDITDIGFRVTAAANPNLKWESTTQTNIGLDFSLFRNRLNGSLDYYMKTTRDLLMPRQLATMTGLASVIDNVGSVENKGIDFSINGDIFTGALRWNSGFTISANRNKTLDIGDNPYLKYVTTLGGFGIDGGLLYLKKGEPFGQMYGYGYEGIWSVKEAAEAAAYGQLPGDPKYTDYNKDGVIDAGDRMVIGNALPDYVFGWNNRFSFRNFDLTFLIQGVQGNDVFNTPQIRLESTYEGKSKRLLDRWTPENQNTDIPAFTDELTRINANLVNKIAIPGNEVNQTSHFVENGSYIRLKNINLSYSLSPFIYKKLGISGVRLYFSGMNLITITNYSGFDPEVSSFKGNDARIGIDFSNYPTSKVYTFGIDVSF